MGSREDFDNRTISLLNTVDRAALDVANTHRMYMNSILKELESIYDTDLQEYKMEILK